MTPLVAKIHERSKRFHADIARRAALVTVSKDQSYSIPNTPFGVPKIRTERPMASEAPIDRAYWPNMWFFDLVCEHSPSTAGEPPRVERIQAIVCRHFGVSKLDLLSEKRSANIALPRQIAMYLSKTLTVRSFPDIGRRFGGRDHSTAVHAVRKVASMIAGNDEFAGTIAKLRKEILA